MRKTNSFKLAVVAVGMLAIGTVSAQTTDLDVTAVGKKGTIKTLKVGNGITSEFDATDNSTTYSIGGILTAPATITADGETGGTNYFAIDGIGRADITTESPAVTAAGAIALGLPGATVNVSGLSLMVRDEATGEVKKLLAEDAAKFLSVFNKAVRTEGNPDATGKIAVAGLVKAIVDMNPGKLFVYKNGVKLIIDTDFTVADGEVTISLPTFITDLIEVQFTN
ncbi:hypothetical protein F7647_10135 [Tenacibaculum piscium]|uniref:hypothetical protein n=1 Tax=Tenacibaculum piscium TaxID=1458515 RepID=UPI00187B82EC|nr:hypothetical protein [Tenacibaculum piscium]MBE7686405.1 hypothetical protein [Tenacibaculum piscium]